MAFALNRIDGTRFLPLLRAENVRIHGDKAMMKLQSPAMDAKLYFPAFGGVIAPETLALAADVLAQLTAMDNEVQQASAAEWANSSSSYPSSYYEGELYAIELIPPDVAVLQYNVIGCNSNWDERFTRVGGRWTRSMGAVPDGGA